ncbi:hypothetical protein WICPIJ_002655 [Wickerhamomyces pijperi]|uniref:Uncharacterized protein n=1 Tax=Wickerhamomyces pijperi TaxID=599730 RepID=A0A9P8Q8R3_WICPI|nr:hypothetical protein WICPIJ_002655 [Wickerhamomyces pijperi]
MLFTPIFRFAPLGTVEVVAEAVETGGPLALCIDSNGPRLLVMNPISCSSNTDPLLLPMEPLLPPPVPVEGAVGTTEYRLSLKDSPDSLTFLWCISSFSTLKNQSFVSSYSNMVHSTPYGFGSKR